MKEPKIRFKGFSGEWKIEKIGNFSTSFSGGTPTAGVPAYYGGNIPFIRSGEIHEDKTELSLTEKGYNNSSAKIVEIGTLLYALYGATSGDVAISKIQGAINQAILAITPYKLVETDFLADFLLCNKNKIVGELLQGGQGNLSGSLVKDINVAYPCISEQQSIASYFQHLDALIQSTTIKIESLKQVKAASLQSMFPQEGETTPQVRFKGFEGEWEKVKFGEVAKIRRGLTYSPFNLRDKGIRVLRSSNIDEDTFVISENDVFVNKECINIEYAEEGDILVTAANGSPRLVGKHAIINNIGTNTTVVGGFMLLISSNESTFLNASMSSSWYSQFLKVGVAGGNGAIGNLNKQDLEDCELLIPNKKEERNHIASYFTTLDRQITLQTQRLEKLKQIKAACLDKMFV